MGLISHCHVSTMIASDHPPCNDLFQDEATPVEIEYLEPDRVVQVAAAGATTARRSSAEHLIATKALRCTATARMLIAAERFAKF